MTRTLFITVLLAVVFASITAAQSSSGQVCIRAFEDRNGNGISDANEPPITRGISVTLGDASGVIIDTAIMENSPTASSGTLCFQRLPEGQYTLRVSSANYQATGASEFVTVANASGVVDVLPYGAQVIPEESLPATTPALSQEDRLQANLVRMVFAGLSAILIMGAMVVVGALIYFFVLRKRSQPVTGVYQPVPETGQTNAVPATGQYQPVETPAAPQPTPTTAMDDTDMPNVVTQEDTYSM